MNLKKQHQNKGNTIMTYKNDFEILCNELLTLLEEEYDMIKQGNYKDLNDIAVIKSKKQEEFQNFLKGIELQALSSERKTVLSNIYKASARNSSYLAGAIEGISSLLRELRRAGEVQTFTGLYAPDGSFKTSEHTQKTIGRA